MACLYISPRISPKFTVHWVLARVRTGSAIPSSIALNLSLLCTETVSSLQAFRKRHADAQRLHSQFASQPTTVDFAHYRAVLKNKAVVDEAEKTLKDFKPVTYDVGAHIKAIEAFEAKAVSLLRSSAGLVN